MTTEKIQKEQLLERMNKGEVTVLNVLSSEDYQKLHIKGSLSTPLDDLKDEGWYELDSKVHYVTHCSGPMCTACEDAAEFLMEKGFKVSVYRGGLKEWSESRLPMEGSHSYDDYEKTPRL